MKNAVAMREDDQRRSWAKVAVVGGKRVSRASRGAWFACGGDPVAARLRRLPPATFCQSLRDIREVSAGAGGMWCVVPSQNFCPLICAQSADATLTAFSAKSPLARRICLRWNFPRMKQNPIILCILLVPRWFSPVDFAGADFSTAAHEIHRA